MGETMGHGDRPANGAESIVGTLIGAGVDVCFANPGTSEIHLVAGLDKQDGLWPVLCLHESVATGAADGYGRMAEKPALTLLHLGAGLANGLANLHNAKRARTPVVNIVGGHATFHDRYPESPLASDIEGFARPVSAWVHRTADVTTAAADAARAVEAALKPPGQIATLIVPADVSWAEGGQAAAARPRPRKAVVANAAIDQVAGALARGGTASILMRGEALKERGLTAAGRIAARTGARLVYDTLVPRIQRGAGRVKAERIPYFPEAAADFFRETGLLILVGAAAPVSIFGSPDTPSWSAPEGCQIIHLAHADEDGVAALEALAEAIGAATNRADTAELALPILSGGMSLSAESVGQVVAFHLPENAIIVDETVSSGHMLQPITATARPHDHLSIGGGAIGWALAAATGAAVACPGRKTICLHGDGGAAMALQALWTQARENLNITTVIFSNRSYTILNMEMERAGFHNIGSRAQSLFDLTRPTLDWVKLAEGLGVEGSRAESVGAFSDQFASALRSNGPRLVEAVI
jgi:acetolactate synthase I/II/III large subunit